MYGAREGVRVRGVLRDTKQTKHTERERKKEWKEAMDERSDTWVKERI